MVNTIDTNATPRTADGGFRLSGTIFVAALAVRLIYLWQSAANPTFNTPVVDAWTYHERALALAAGQADASLFWQPVFYPLFLAGVYKVFGPSFLMVKLIQACIGALTCTLAANVASRVFGGRAGWIAGIITCLYGPLIFFDGEPLGAGWAAMWMMLLSFLLVRLRERLSIVDGACLGLASALSVLTRPTFAAPLLLAGVWLAVTLLRTMPSRAAAGRVLAVIVIGFVLIALPASLWTRHIAGRLTLLPASGGINLYIGNNPNTDSTIRIRPGYRWTLLDQLPAKHGTRGMWESSAWFNTQVRTYITQNPGDWLRGMASKTMQLLSSRELPRNVDVYVFRDWSSLLAVTTWKVGRFGFPFGVVLPLAVIGYFAHRKRVFLVLPLMIVGYGCAVALVFVSARYRLPIAAPLCVLAAGGITWLVDACRAKRWGAAAIACASGVLMAAVFSALGPFPQERNDYRAELDLFLARAAYRDGDDAATLSHLTAAARRIPQDSGVQNALAKYFMKTGDISAAGQHAARAVDLDANNYEAHETLGDAHMAVGRPATAIEAYTAAIETGPPEIALHHKLSGAQAQLGRFADAITQLAAALKIDANDVTTLRMLARALATAPSAAMRDPQRVLELAQRARSDGGGDDALLLSAVAAAQAQLGRFDDAVASAERAVQLAPQGSPLAQQLARERDLYRQGRTYPTRP